ncbi:molybdopterin-binding protein [Roseibaca sp. V10]|uniref:Molybdopterin-binding protein n=1 Tax=Roseinatronobacter domitianus TaxID=2940293 RepID=A0ABT0LXB0_9RHOB|nr:molybdopterin-binding protein [Roseibaca domitiana]
MRFGPVPLALAHGAVLAHSRALPDGRLRKGCTLGPSEIARLRAAGVAEVVVAQPDPADMPEDDAALAVARALVPADAGLSLRAVGTGRVNIVADGPGLVALDAPAVHAVNAVDPAITLATLPPLMRVERGTMVATVKIIPYAVAGKAVQQAAQAATDALRLRRPVIARAALILTRAGGADPGEKGARVTQDRLARLGVAMDRARLVDHKTDALADALRATDAPLVLILTGSATSDMHDTAPEALRRAGGQVAHFGMPVDPGNLLFLGDLNGRPVIGLPGCAKSPALNGADWVMERIICGLTVTAADIMAMGVGGLLAEIPSRPRPRRQGEGGAQ